jgi:hypothetical protein
MGRSRQLTFTLACAVVLSALIPGIAGYLSARLEAIESAERDLHALQVRLEARQSRDIRPVMFPARCGRHPAPPRVDRAPVTALEPDPRPRRHVERPPGRPVWLPELLEALRAPDRQHRPRQQDLPQEHG